MRRTLLAALVLLPLAQAQAPKESAAAIAAARADLQAQLEIADMLLQRGDVDAAAAAYRRAMEKFAAALGGQGAAAPKPVPALAPEDPALRAEEATRVPIPEWARSRVVKGKRALKAGGGSGLTENAVATGLEWLAKHQDEDGRFDCDGFMKHDAGHDRCDGAGDPSFDLGVTGLALLAFLGDGHTDTDGTYADNVRRGLHFLIANQADDGKVGGRDPNWIYEHAIATTVFCEAYAMTRSPRAREAATRAVDFLQNARNPDLAWRYQRNGDNDTSVTAWCVMALHAARCAGLKADPSAFLGARKWVEKVTDPNWGTVGYIERGGPPARLEKNAKKFPDYRTHSMTAAGILIRTIAGDNPRENEMIRKGLDACIEVLPTWNPEDGSIDMYYWYQGTLAVFQCGGYHWRKWNEAMVEALVKHQHPKGTGARAGSWDPLDPWGEVGGRVYSTALLTMCLEVYYRNERIVPVK